MKKEELNAKTEDQLQNLLKDNKKELMNLRFQLVSSSLTNTSRVKYVRRMIAKIKTLLNNQPSKVGVKNA